MELVRRRLILLAVLLSAVIAYEWLCGTHLTREGAIATPSFGTERIHIVRTISTWYGEAVLFEDEDDGSFGVVRLQRRFGLWWRNAGGSYGQRLEPGRAIESAGYFTSTGRAEDQTIVAAKVDPRIHYLVSGSTDPDARYAPLLSLKEARSQPEVYRVETVKDGYVFFVVDQADVDRELHIFHGYDEDGVLIADKQWDARWYPTASGGWAAYRGQVLHTADGGQTWAAVLTLPEQDRWRGYAAVQFASDTTGWALFCLGQGAASQEPYLLYSTQDGGKTWTPRLRGGWHLPSPAPAAPIGPGGYPRSLAAAGDTAWVAVDSPAGGYLEVVRLASGGGGAVSGGKIPLPGAARPAVQLSAQEGERGCLTIGEAADRKVFCTEDGGATWRTAP